MIFPFFCFLIFSLDQQGEGREWKGREERRRAFEYIIRRRGDLDGVSGGGEGGREEGGSVASGRSEEIEFPEKVSARLSEIGPARSRPPLPPLIFVCLFIYLFIRTQV